MLRGLIETPQKQWHDEVVLSAHKTVRTTYGPNRMVRMMASAVYNATDAERPHHQAMQWISMRQQHSMILDWR